MNIYEFADVIDKEIIIIRYPNQHGRFSACFASCEIKQGIILCGEYGNGETPQEAVNNYKNEISGKNIVFHAGSNEHRQEYVAPNMEDI